MSAMKEFFTEIFMWWIDWLADGEAYELVFRFIATILFFAMIGAGIYFYLINK
jgi:hypothetical protein